ncbi:UPF0415 protein C7orf25 homolog [Galendromus occidentalis]|uniref:UPF0415 protein C7orf25 homolog n=1 Tax=Galendromus occidentalis TaxID=34638 RepID=A0AAJ6QM70_9ACAR|nr:UPF0415 protein C7orf25 homolog [Galendromus occidentalis]
MGSIYCPDEQFRFKKYKFLAPTTPEEGCLEIITCQLKDAQTILTRCAQLPLTPGTGKLQRKIQAEIKFYNQCLKGKIKKENLTGNNLPYLSSLIDCAFRVEGFKDVMKPFAFPENDCLNDLPEEDYFERPERISVDVVADGGKSWIKVVARKPEALLASIMGDGEYGRRTLMHQIRDMVACSKHHPHLYTIPQVKVLFACSHPVPEELKTIVEEAGATVMTTIGDKPSDDGFDCGNGESSTFRSLRLEEVPEDAILNLDVSTMIAYVSALTNGRANFQFQENILSEQAESERKDPIKPVLEQLFEKRKLICCHTAFKDFTQITKLLAGPTENAATTKLLNMLEIVPDDPSERTSELDFRGKVKQRPVVVFGTGDSWKAVTVTSNLGFLRAAAGQGLPFVAFVHSPRALTEKKEATATPL